MTLISKMELYYENAILKLITANEDKVNKDKSIKLDLNSDEVIKTAKEYFERLNKMHIKSLIKEEKEKVYNKKTAERIQILYKKFETAMETLKTVEIEIEDKNSQNLKSSEVENEFKIDINGKNERQKESKEIDSKLQKVLRSNMEEKIKLTEIKSVQKASERQKFEEKAAKMEKIEKLQQKCAKEKELQKNDKNDDKKDKISFSKEFEKNIIEFEENSVRETYKNGLNALKLILKNIVSEPSFENYRMLKKRNESLRRDLTGTKLGENCLKSIGFKELIVEEEEERNNKTEIRKIKKKEVFYFLEEPNVSSTDDWCKWYDELRKCFDFVQDKN